MNRAEIALFRAKSYLRWNAPPWGMLSIFDRQTFGHQPGGVANTPNAMPAGLPFTKSSYDGCHLASGRNDETFARIDTGCGIWSGTIFQICVDPCHSFRDPLDIWDTNDTLQPGIGQCLSLIADEYGPNGSLPGSDPVWTRDEIACRFYQLSNLDEALLILANDGHVPITVSDKALGPHGSMLFTVASL
ncbi:uncharacterized protein Z518_01138 [Rhinocladiella mackenziei CBS 650.93]|uniref:Uncharacterized protein n=1 Tax=Rhinocladiella mackenziei CBS 650.93 TaxID=1442369 RepID=A0A0D2G5G7_9EURO|nr:uncharacterized protein Z518_01138 [Rhinocladiella mackenziei CBS 650.93]KIX10057.1 hypothetical protein Z518_01138 [Rhinocladiella mackenziei CBS 650.93]